MSEESDKAELAEMRRKREDSMRGERFARVTFSAEDSLVALKPDEHGVTWWQPYQGQPFDPERARVVKGGWDHEHCYSCSDHILPGDLWWAVLPPSRFKGQFGLCLDCYDRLFIAGRSISAHPAG